MDFKGLTIVELAAYAGLCEKRKVELFRDMNLYRGDKVISKKYNDLLAVEKSLSNEIDSRLFNNSKESTDNEENSEKN
jgi:hypothetical protein